MNITSTLCVGIDVSLDANQVCAMNFDQHKFFNKSFENSFEGTQQLIKEIAQIISLHGFDAVTFAMEATSLYFFHIANSLSNAEELKLFHVEVYCLNAKIAKKYKDSFLGMPKNDPLDAYSLCDFVRVEEQRNSINGAVRITSLSKGLLDIVITLLYSLPERRITF